GDMIALIQRIVKNRLAYVVGSGVYFDVEKWRGKHRAGRLSRQSLDEQHGQRLEHAADKKSPHDFALWVLNQPGHLMQWDSPWGRGYPGWHIECSAMSMKYLGETIDIHSGGLDHVPVHHENEIAQSEGATGHPFVRYFIHNAFLVGMEGAKISKSAGRFPILDDLIAADIDPLAFRWLCLMAKYRSELIFTVDAVRAAQNSLLRLYNFIADMPEAVKEGPDAGWVGEYVERFGEALNDDLNTAQALAVVFEVLTAAHRMRDYNVCNAIRKFDSILGVDLENAQQKIAVLSESSKTQDVAAHLKARQRKQLRESKQYEKADALRQELLQSGYKVEDVRAAPGYRLKRLFVAGGTP
ncbi:MAG: DALR domain-containing protein, partial [Candidatus Binataceae bacterium]